MYVLRRDLTKPGPSPYVLDQTHGDMPRSSIDVLVQLKSKPDDKPLALKLEDYLSIPPPRTTRIALIGHMLAAQYPQQITSPTDIAAILFMPFHGDGGIIKGRSTSGVGMECLQQQQQQEKQKSGELPETDKRWEESFMLRQGSRDDRFYRDNDSVNDMASIHFAQPEMSLRFPCIQLPVEDMQSYLSGRDWPSPRPSASQRHMQFVERESQNKRLSGSSSRTGSANYDNHKETPSGHGRPATESRNPTNGAQVEHEEGDSDDEHVSDPLSVDSAPTKKSFSFQFPGFDCIRKRS